MMRQEGRKGKKKPLNNASNVMSKSYAILLAELGMKDRVIAMQRDAIESLESALKRAEQDNAATLR